MRLADLSKRLSARILATVVAGVLVALGFLAVFVIPEYREAGRLRQQIVVAKADIEIQSRLAPLRAKLTKAESVLGLGGLTVKAEPMPLRDVGRLTEIVEGLAKPAGLRVASVSPEPNSAGRNGLLAVNIRLLGAMAAIREFLLSLCRFGPLVSIESATSVVGADGRELSLKCWLSVR